MGRKKMPLIRFDWAMKKILRHKANFDILEGFLSELLNQNLKIKNIIDSESNQETADDKHNRVDIFVENEKGELLIIEVQNSSEFDYFHRILFGTAKAITEHIQKKAPYSEVKKIYSITIAYFDAGQGEDYIYHGTTVFKGVHKGDTLGLSLKQEDLYEGKTPADIYPEYFLIKVENFKDRIKDPIDEWVYFFKNAEVRDDFKARGISEAKEKLKEINLPEKQRVAYLNYMRSLHDLASEEYNKNIAYQIALEKAIERGIKKGIEEELEEELEKEVEKVIEKS